MNTYLFVFTIVFVFWIFLVFKFRDRYKLSKEKKLYFNKQLKKISLLTSLKEQVVDLDKLYHKILQTSWYTWTFWEILKQKPSEIPNLNKIWELHKLRNKLVHELEPVSDKELQESAKKYIYEVKVLIENF